MTKATLKPKTDLEIIADAANRVATLLEKAQAAGFLSDSDRASVSNPQFLQKSAALIGKTGNHEILGAYAQPELKSLKRHAQEIMDWALPSFENVTAQIDALKQDESSPSRAAITVQVVMFLAQAQRFSQSLHALADYCRPGDQQCSTAGKIVRPIIRAPLSLRELRERAIGTR